MYTYIYIYILAPLGVDGDAAREVAVPIISLLCSFKDSLL